MLFRSGDLIVAVRVQVPTKLTARQRELIQQLKETEQPPKAAKGGEGSAKAKGGKGAGKDGRSRGGFWGKVKETFGE